MVHARYFDFSSGLFSFWICGRIREVQCSRKFPIIFDLTAVVDDSRGNEIFQLFALIDDYGSIGGGHYTATTKSPVSRK